jgi:hypothetical protein
MYICCGNTTTATINYRFLSPSQVIDLNENLQEVQRDALGRVLATSFYGTKLGAEGHATTFIGNSQYQ